MNVARTILDWPSITTAVRRRLRRLEEVTEEDMVRWLIRRRPDLSEADARHAVQVVLSDID